MFDDRRTNTDYQQTAPSVGKRACAALRRDGQPCRAPAVRAHADPAAVEGRVWFCQAHDPARDPEAAREASARGGRNRANAVRALQAAPADLRSLLDTLYAAVIQTRDGEISPSQAQAIGALTGSIVKAVEVAELTGRLEELEQRLAPPRPASRPALPRQPERQFAPAHAIAADREEW